MQWKGLGTGRTTDHADGAETRSRGSPRRTLVTCSTASPGMSPCTRSPSRQETLKGRPLGRAARRAPRGRNELRGSEAVRRNDVHECAVKVLGTGLEVGREVRGICLGHLRISGYDVSRITCRLLGLSNLRRTGHSTADVISSRLVSRCTGGDDSSGQSDFAPGLRGSGREGLPKLEVELGPDDCTLALPKLWSLLPGLNNLRHLDLEKDLSQNGIGDTGMYELSLVLIEPSVTALSSVCTVTIISDVGAHWLATVLPLMVSLTDLDVKYNNLTDVGPRALEPS
ncbi:unnamed protein product [Arctogadus glacialis]